MEHPKASEASNDILIEEEIQNVHPVIYDSIDSETVLDAIKKTRGSARPSRLDADTWRRILMLGNFATSGQDLRKAIPNNYVKVAQLNILKQF